MESPKTKRVLRQLKLNSGKNVNGVGLANRELTPVMSLLFTII